MPTREGTLRTSTALAELRATWVAMSWRLTPTRCRSVRTIAPIIAVIGLHDAITGAGLLAAAVIGFFFCLTLRRTGSLWFAVGFHAAWDWGETFFYSVPDSGTLFPGHLLHSSFHGARWLTGGKVGPEGSVLCFVVIALVWGVFAKAYPEVRYGRQNL